MPKLSDTMEEGKILRWLKQAGDAISAGEVIAEVETDKADMELEASESGVLRAIRVAEGESAAVGDVLAVIDESGEGAGTAREAAAPTARAEPGETPRRLPAAADGATSTPASPPLPSPTAAKPRATSDRSSRRAGGARSTPKASAAAQALADEHGIDLARVRGSGPDGRIVHDDVAAAVAREPSAEAAAPARARATPPTRGPRRIARRRSSSGTSFHACASRSRGG